MATITAQTIPEAGLAVVFTAVNASDVLTNNGNSYLHVKNANAAACTVTLDATRTCDHGFDHNIVVSVPATTGDMVLPPMPLNRFSKAVTVTYSVTASVTAALVTLTST